MRLGAPVFPKQRGARAFVECVRGKGYRAAYCPEYLASSVQAAEIDELKCALSEYDIALAEVGAWVNPLSPDRREADRARAYVVDRLRLADLLGARCCVNILGSRSAAKWYAPCAENFTETFFEDAVRLYRGILDEAQPRNTTLAFEIMPFCLLDSAEEYARFLTALDHPAASVHLDPVNLLRDARTLYGHRALFRRAVDLLGSRVVSMHVKDITLDPEPVNTKMDEVRLGLGDVDLGYMLDQAARIPGDPPLMLEHLPCEAEYDLAAEHLRKIAAARGYAL